MRFLSKIVKFVKSTISKIVEMFSDKNPVEVINDTVKAGAAVATAALAVYAGINKVRVQLMSRKENKNNDSGKSGYEYFRENRTPGSVDEKLAKLKRDTKNITNKNYISNMTDMQRRDFEALKEYAKTRNVWFRSLPVRDQLSVLEAEGFDFAKYCEEYSKSKARPLFPWGKRLKKLGVSPEDKPFREKVDFGKLNFIMRPIDDFIHWIKNDPVPKEVPQIKLIDFDAPLDFECKSKKDLIAVNAYLADFRSGYKYGLQNSNDPTVAEIERMEIGANELFNHKSLTKLNKAVEKKMKKSKYNTPDILQLFDEELDEMHKKKKKKDKKKKNKKKNKKKSNDRIGSMGYINEGKEKYNKRKSKSQLNIEKSASEFAAKSLNYHIQKAMNGEFDMYVYTE